MIESVSISLKFPEEQIPALPGLGDDNEVRAVIALHLEKTLFCEGDQEQFESHIETIFEDLCIDDEKAQKNILNMLAKYESFLVTLIGHLYEQGKKKVAEEGTFSYPIGKNAYQDKDDNYWKIDIDRLQKNEADYDDVQLSDGQTVFVFNPTVKDGRIMVHSGNIKVRTWEDGTHGGMINKLQAHLLANSQCSCGNTPCTCGGAIAALPDDDEEPVNEFEEWDNLMKKANDRDVILVYRDGEEVMRF